MQTSAVEAHTFAVSHAAVIVGTLPLACTNVVARACVNAVGKAVSLLDLCV